LKSATLRFTAVQNVLTLTKYNGLDPEKFNGIDNNVYPRARTFLFGVNANF
jgi:iron complex outermembrane receptor protein